jgi:hypothetical protein
MFDTPYAAPFRVASDDMRKLFLICPILTVGCKGVIHNGSGLRIQAPHFLVNRINAEVWTQICPHFGSVARGSRFISLLKGDHFFAPIRDGNQITALGHVL